MKTITSDEYKDLYINLQRMKAYVKDFTREHFQSLVNEDVDMLRHLWHIERRIGLTEQKLEALEEQNNMKYIDKLKSELSYLESYANSYAAEHSAELGYEDEGACEYLNNLDQEIDYLKDQIKLLEEKE